MTLDIYGKILLAAIQTPAASRCSVDPGAAWQPAERFIRFAGPERG